jgi:hypothetical protein
MTRRIVRRTRGHSSGPIVRLMSPSDLGEHLKPFVFLDLFEADMRCGCHVRARVCRPTSVSAAPRRLLGPYIGRDAGGRRTPHP